MKRKIFNVFLLSVGQVLAVVIIVGTTMTGWQSTQSTDKQFLPDEQKTAQELKEIVTVLAEEIGDRNYASYHALDQAAEYIIEKFQAIGYSVEVMRYRHEGREFKNISVEKIPEGVSEEIVVVGAHYDTCFNPGADDNASGVAGLLALARLFKERDVKRRIKFVAFVNEEPPFYKTAAMGSRVYTRRAKKNKEKIVAAVILECIGFFRESRNSQRYPPLLGPFYPNKANFIAVAGNFSSRRLVKKVVGSFREASSFPVEWLIAPRMIAAGIDFSDHWSFWEEGYPAVMVTDTAFYRNKNYHNQNDLPSTLDYDKMTRVVYGLQAAILDLVDENK
ncbi:MAG: M28 family peptidase [Candidatus Omnitrophica bacterium]|nr:M28 family peptidase [Candidatus Omnitrophota bacterium]